MDQAGLLLNHARETSAMRDHLDRLMSPVTPRSSGSGVIAQLCAAVGDLRIVEMQAQVVANELRRPDVADATIRGATVLLTRIGSRRLCLIRRADACVRQAAGALGAVQTRGLRLLLAELTLAERHALEMHARFQQPELAAAS